MRHASGLHRSSSPHAALLTAWFGWAVLLHWRPCAARFRLVVIAFVSPRVSRCVEGCREAHVPIYGACHRFTMNTIDMVLRSLGGLLILYRAVLISDRRARYIYTKLAETAAVA